MAGETRRMDIDREMLMQIGVSLIGVGFFIIAVVWIGMQYSDNGLAEEGAIGLIGAIAGFILLMTALGYWLSGLET